MERTFHTAYPTFVFLYRAGHLLIDPTSTRRTSIALVNFEFLIRRILANYMVWHLIKPLIGELSKPFRDASLELLKIEKGVENGAQPWKSCVTKTNSVMGFATGYLYIQERSGKNTKKQVGN